MRCGNPYSEDIFSILLMHDQNKSREFGGAGVKPSNEICELIPLNMIRFTFKTKQ